MGNHSLPMLMTIVVVFMVGMMTSLADAQTADCAQKLVPCASYINATNPPASCCNPIKEAVATQLPCLCGLYTTPGLLKSFGITVEQALNLTRNCGLNSDISKCNGIFFFFFFFFFIACSYLWTSTSLVKVVGFGPPVSYQIEKNKILDRFVSLSEDYIKLVENGFFYFFLF